jgi:glycerol uptake facilitator-like aquaporin
MNYSNVQKYFAEFIGTAFLLATVIGSGIMGETLAGGNVAIALLGNTIATGAILYVLITLLGPISGAHFNPAVTLGFRLNGDIDTKDSVIYVAVQIIGAIIGVWAAHLMFDQPIWQISQTVRAGPAQGFSEGIATFGLVLVILGTVKVRTDAVPMAVGLYITAAYWFTASTSFANPAVTIARSLSDTFAGIRPADIVMFIFAQVIAAVLAWWIYRLLFRLPDKP